MKNIFLLALVMISFVACSQQQKGKTVATNTQTGGLISPTGFNEKLQKEKGVLIDVRTPGEYKKGHLKGARLLDIFSDNFETEIDKLDKNATYFVYCATGGRSGECAELMQKKGFKKVYDMDGGIRKWQSEGLPVDTN